MSTPIVPAQPADAYRVVLELTSSKPRLDQVLLEALRKTTHPRLKRISRTDFKELFKKKHVRIKGQPATPSSAIAQGTTYVDIIGYADETAPK